MEFSAYKFREIVFQLLFSIDLNGGGEPELIPLLMETLSVAKKHVDAAYVRAELIWAHREKLDSYIASSSQEYAFERIKKVELNVLRLILFELLIEKQLPSKILLAEGHRLTRKFGTPEGASFVNALLDTPQCETSDAPLTPLCSSNQEASERAFDL